jgi:hypothetical protein
VSSAAELLGMEEWIVATLQADATFNAHVPGGVFAGYVPDGTPEPYCVMMDMGGPNDAMTVNANRLLVSRLYLVKVVKQAKTSSGLRAAVADIDRLLHRKSGSVSDTIIDFCNRERAYRLAHGEDTQVFQEAGGFYRILARAS